MFERRYRLNGELSTYHHEHITDIRHIDLDGDIRIEFTLYGQSITLYPENWAGYDTWLMLVQAESLVASLHVAIDTNDQDAIRSLADTIADVAKRLPKEVA